MKKLLLTLLAAAAVYNVQAQNINAAGDHERMDIPHEPNYADSLAGWSIEGTLMAGGMSQSYTGNSMLNAYIMPVNSRSAGLKFNMGPSLGMEGQGAYFFGKKRNWGIGMGFSYFVHTGSVTLDNFHAEYATYDNYNNIYRQMVTSNGQVKENIRMYTVNVPIVAKYQTRFSKRIGFTADAGLLLNLYAQNSYKTNASFDYEAVYRYVGNDGAVTTAYDPSPTPDPASLVITKERYMATNSAGEVNTYFNSMRAQGYNVALGAKANDNTGTVNYKAGTLGFIVRPALSIYIKSNLMLNVGLYYTYQAMSNVPSSDYMITNRIGEYSSVLNTVKRANTHAYGVSVGVRYNFKKKSPKPEPVVAEAPVPDEDKEPVASPAPEEETANVDISTPILFDLDKVVIKEASIPILEEAANQLLNNPNAKLTIHGYTDNTGKKDYNKRLSNRRAAVVKEYLKKKGVNPRILKTVGHGESHPAASNKTKEGRMRNRRAVMRKDDE